MRNLILFFLLICLIAFVGCTTTKTSATVEIYTIEVSGTNGLKFSGSYGGITSDGEAVAQSVEGVVPAEYTVQGTSDTIFYYCSFVKQEEAGTLNVFIYKNGQLATQGGTADPFGSVLLATN